MVTWKNYWRGNEWEELKKIKIGGREVETFKNMPPNLYDALAESVSRFPEKIALTDPWERRYSYKDFLKKVDDFALSLSCVYGIKKGDHAALMLYNGIEFCVAFLALCKLGAVTVSLPSKYKKQEVLSLCMKAEASYIICDEDFYEWFENAEEYSFVRIKAENAEKGYGFAYLARSTKGYAPLVSRGALEDPVLIMFTSGTTSQSKGVLLKNYNVMHSVVTYEKTLKLTSEDRSVIATPIYHITGMITLLGEFLYIGASLYLHRKFEPEKVLQCALENKLTFIHASPTVFCMLMDKKDMFPSIPSLNSFACGSSNMSPENIRRIYEWLPQVKFHTIYGLTETAGAGTVFPGGAAESRYIGASGIPMPNLEVRIADDTGKEVPSGIVGEVMLKGTFVLEEYYHGVSSAITEDGWLKTGDLGYCNRDGYLYIVDRKKDMINRGGEKICSFDVENEIMQLNGILEAAVVGVPDEKYGEIPVAVIRFAPGVEWKEGAVQKELEHRIAKYKIPCRILPLSDIPKTANGKIDKNAIRHLFVP
ncbi:hypothetical protein C3B58_03305 [Lactonifactor longoviformis]|uniref:Long-chain acyl-CoA synthetase n=1 Tax=Lactonifactor longoviformis DSM 17459 TaxID=1122155 RepID=A0A1M4VMI3_9CLOT|nr:class I adenylate-forming enzyme family protein [Lactonifactor longoviformis]POP34336.1 hypothetical protein C3B58_03305 [Lactonifactor longoviformis]SHE70281.1 long-chain acyl-CoA synthetase [Lactonifactor longoviformis DSM 17459]